MPLLSRLSSLWRNLFRKARMEQELAEEIDAYTEMLVDLKIEKGLNPGEARRVALIELGGKEQIKEKVREVSVGHYLETLWQDLRFGLRMLRKNPGFTAVAVLTLTIGIGANVAIFSVVYGVLLQPLPYAEGDRLVTLIQAYPQKGLSTWGISQANFALYRDQNRVFEKVAAYTPAGFNLTGGDSPERLQAASVTVDFFDVLGVQPGWGRAFLPEEDTPGKNLVCIISYGLWQRRFGGDLQMLGKPLLLNNVPTEVVGIMPPGFAYPNRNVELWLPVGLNPQRLSPYTLVGIARLKPAVSAVQAEAETTDIFWNAAQENPAIAGATVAPPEGADMKTIVRPLKDVIVGETKTPLLILLGAVGLVLLIVCANVANLLLVRAASRTREFAFRFALGASAGRVIRQLLTESLLLGLIGGVTGTTLAYLGVRLLRQLPALQQLPRLEEVSVNPTVLAFTAALSVLTGLLFGLAPALRTYQIGLLTGMREGMRGSAGPINRRLNSVLVSAQFALCLVLLIGAGLLLKSFQRMLSVSPGFQPEHVLSMRLALPNNKYANAEQSAQFYESLLERVRSLPGIRSAGVVSYLPFGGNGEADGFIVEGHEPESGGVAPNAQIRVVSPGYIQTLEIPLLRGRDFLPSDRADSPLVAMVDETLARRYWADGDAIGKRIRFSWSDQWMTIVGVTAGVKNRNLRETAEPHLYYPHAQDPSRQMYLTVRTAAEPTSATAAIQSEVRALDANLPVWKVQTLTEAVGQTLNNQRLTNTLLTVFALLAVLLAAIGIYGVMSLYVSNRTKEFGIRLALGAQPVVLLRSVLRQGLALALAGVVVGTIIAVALTRMLASLLFEVSATDPAIFIGVPLLLVAVALLACYIPARRAMRVDPLEALRYE
ncbi:MAG TPA: ABC transporter permease [Blastocatellia bacterium]|nr:ABC transporter permease [Blastocatellia bacterium]